MANIDPVTGQAFANYSKVGTNHYLFPVPGMNYSNAVRINNFNPKTDTLVLSDSDAGDGGYNSYYDPDTKSQLKSHPFLKKLFKLKKPVRTGMYVDVNSIDKLQDGIIHWSSDYRDGDKIVKGKKNMAYVYADSNGSAPGFGEVGGLMAIVKSKLPLIFVQGFDQYYNFRTEYKRKDFVVESGLTLPFFLEDGSVREVYRNDRTYTSYSNLPDASYTNTW